MYAYVKWAVSMSWLSCPAHSDHVTICPSLVSECGPFCVYSYACYSGRIVGAGKNKPSLKTIFTVIHK